MENKKHINKYASMSKAAERKEKPSATAPVLHTGRARHSKKNIDGYIATVGKRSVFDRLTLFNVKLLCRGQVVGHWQHVNVACKPFKSFKKGDLVKFTGQQFKYQREDLTYDYSVKVKKASLAE